MISFLHSVMFREIFILDRVAISAKNYGGAYSNYIYFAEIRLCHFVKEHSDAMNSD